MPVLINLNEKPDTEKMTFGRFSFVSIDAA